MLENNIIKSPFFFIGLILKFFLIIYFEQSLIKDYYLPFLELSTNQISLDPWQTWLENDGSIAAFPYGYGMWIFFLPFIFLVKFLDLPMIIGYHTAILSADILFLLVIKNLTRQNNNFILFIYWFSPIILTSVYLLGYNDIIPMLFILLAIKSLNVKNFFASGILCILSISIKISMVLVIPFFFIFILNNSVYKHKLHDFLKGIFLGFIVLLLPFVIFSPSGISMIYKNPEVSNIYSLSLDFKEQAQIFIFPLVYFLIFYIVVQVNRINFILFMNIVGSTFLLITILTPSPPGWYVWTILSLVLYQSQSNNDKFSIPLSIVFSILFLVINLLKIEDQYFIYFNLLYSWLNTALITIGIIILMRIGKYSFYQNDFFKLSRKPFVLGISGDSGSGKDNLVSLIINLFGKNSVTSISGDDYHLWDRKKPMWKILTHLNPLANNLEQLTHDIINLINGKNIFKKKYDHETGRMSLPEKINSNDIILVSGLHALYLPILRKCYDLSIFIEMDEKMRKFLKVRRDSSKRGHSVSEVKVSLKRREKDSEIYIKPQAKKADLIISLHPVNSNFNEKIDFSKLKYKLVITSRNWLSEVSLSKALIGLCGLNVEMKELNDSDQFTITIEGEPSEKDIELSAKLVCPKTIQFLDFKPKWEGGVQGLIQLITLVHIDQVLTKKMV
tara:strand:+ start:447 stop:2465 length:2019 start_codon:yes stop_codon:yes gene_type:complete